MKIQKKNLRGGVGRGRGGRGSDQGLRWGRWGSGQGGSGWGGGVRVSQE